ncbi:hypothetical protein RND71_022194 [Anisodus tanguticus]|uniref:Uncharacterized protein n=1 Tax=Anisodus tanguticus TaxID=243964 RepID=A0AAE1VGW3_9SOLA|nr:hypothetical protein RND71_022194 [Anisodus tanguticus]
MAKISVHYCLLLVMIMYLSVLHPMIAQNHQVIARECNTPIYNITCKENSDCVPSCKEVYKDNLIFAFCMRSTPDHTLVCNCSYYC